MTAARPLDGTEADRATYLHLVKLRDEVMAQIARDMGEQERRLDEQLARSPRWARRRLEALRRRMHGARARIEAEVDRRFAEVTRRYDVETGTVKGVQDDAAAMLADLLGT